MNYGGIGSVIGHEITHGFDDQGRSFNFQTIYSSYNTEWIFHKKGRLGDKLGTNVNWWTDRTLANYLKRAQCFIEQYSNFTVPSGSHVSVLLYRTSSSLGPVTVIYNCMYTIPLIYRSTQINGVTTQGENIADNGGLREAFRAYNLYVATKGPEPKLPGLEQFTSEQIFFLSYANLWCGHETPKHLEDQLLTDPHSPSKYRVLGTLSNNEDFANVFGCAVGTPMNRVNDCILWWSGEVYNHKLQY